MGLIQEQPIVMEIMTSTKFYSCPSAFNLKGAPYRSVLYTKNIAPFSNSLISTLIVPLFDDQSCSETTFKMLKELAEEHINARESRPSVQLVCIEVQKNRHIYDEMLRVSHRACKIPFKRSAASSCLHCDCVYVLTAQSKARAKLVGAFKVL